MDSLWCGCTIIDVPEASGLNARWCGHWAMNHGIVAAIKAFPLANWLHKTLALMYTVHVALSHCTTTPAFWTRSSRQRVPLLHCTAFTRTSVYPD